MRKTDNRKATMDQDTKLIQFAKEIIDEALQGGSYDGGDIQDLAVDYGLLKPTEATESCGNNCYCAEEFGEWPITCYRKEY